MNGFCGIHSHCWLEPAADFMYCTYVSMVDYSGTTCKTGVDLTLKEFPDLPSPSAFSLSIVPLFRR